MAQRCDLTGIGPLTGNHVSHAHNRTKRRQNPNLQTKRVWIPEEKRFIRIKATTRAFRTLDKKGFRAMIAEIARAQ